MALQDIDVFGTINANGTIREYVDDAALGNALVQFLMSKKGDYINDPEEGGLISESIFKNITPGSIDKLKFAMENAIDLRFANVVRVEKISIEPDYQTRMTVINVFYTSLLSNERQSATIYVNDTSKIETFKYQDIDLVDLNLLTFVQLKKPDMIGKKLVYNLQEFCWVWGENFKFINFTNEDPQFDLILATCNL